MLSRWFARRYFGRKGYGTVSGIASLIAVPTSVICPIYVGWVYDTTDSNITAYQQAVAMLIIGIIVMFFADPPKEKPEVISDVGKFI